MAGRPSKYETCVAPRLNEVADWARNGATDKEIAARLDISTDRMCLYKKEFPEFLECLKKTREAVDGEVENALLQAALNGNTTAQIFWLKNRRPKLWRDKPLNDREQDNGGVQIEVKHTIVDLRKDKTNNGN